MIFFHNALQHKTVYKRIMNKTPSRYWDGVVAQEVVIRKLQSILKDIADTSSNLTMIYGLLS